MNLSPQNSNPRVNSALPKSRLVVFDDFSKFDQPNETNHGDLVQFELNRDYVESGGLAVSRQQVDLNFETQDLMSGKKDSLKEFMADHFTDRLEADTEAWKTLVEGGGERSVVHQSQGASESRAVEFLYYRAAKDDELRESLQQQLGLTATADFDDSQKAALLSGLTSLSEKVHFENPAVQSGLSELRAAQKEAADQGHIHVISAGNSGSLFREMQKHMVSIPAKFFVNEMASPDSIVIGASDDQSTEAHSANPHTVARLASPYAGAMFAADGIDRPMSVGGKEGLYRGSSFAAPQVSVKVLAMLEEAPDLTRDELVARLTEQAVPVPGAEDFLGAGVLLS